jgi:hypothetical protein
LDVSIFLRSLYSESTCTLLLRIILFLSIFSFLVSVLFPLSLSHSDYYLIIIIIYIKNLCMLYFKNCHVSHP